MSSKTPPSSHKKRSLQELSMEGPRKKPCAVVKLENNSLEDEKFYRFRVLLPNGAIVELKMDELRNEMPMEEFIRCVRKEHSNAVKEKRSTESKGIINWKYQDLHFTDAQSNEIRRKVDFRDFAPNKSHFLILHDGSAEPETYEDMWDLTPHTDLLKELPDDYTFETALADLIDNSLQALYSNRLGERRLISVELLENKISIFDSGPGMDGSDGNIVKWGKMGASLHRSSRSKAIGGKPPYLMPFFGMFGYGGPVATMHLGRRAVLSSKTKSSNRVYTLHLERDALINSSRPEKRWRTKGGMRDPSQDENENSPHGSFTRVEISDLKMRSLDLKLLQCRLKDIYFPYIQCDEMSGKTSTPIKFQVNGLDLAEIEGGEEATANLHSCNGPNFVFQLHFSFNRDMSSVVGPRQEAHLEANAQLKCVYFPVIQGKESIERIVNNLERDGLGIRESYESFSRVSIRRLGRLLPDARWARLPFMEPKQRKGEMAQILKRCCFRVKCFVVTDAGFNPTPSKTDLAHHHPYTSALKNFGSTIIANRKEVHIEVSRDGKRLSLSQLEKQYHDWIIEMHDRYDEEIDTGLDEPKIIVTPNEKLGRFSDVVRVHKEIKRKETLWKAGQKVKILKGAYTHFHKTNVFATLEYFLLGGLPGDTCGEARFICRPIRVPEARGCYLSDNNLDLRESVSLPLSVIDTGKCIAVDDIEWKSYLEKNDQKLPSSIELLSHEYCRQLEIEGGLFTDVVEAGNIPPENIVAVIRPKSFESASSSKKLDQRFIVREDNEMTLEISFNSGAKDVRKSDHQCAVRVTPSSHKGFHGLYIFPLRKRFPKFQRAGFYTFSFSLKDLRDVSFQQVVQVKGSVELSEWRLISHKHSPKYNRVRVGSQFPPISVECCDQYGNNISFPSIPKLVIKVMSNDCILAKAHSMRVDLATDKSTLTIKDFIVETNKLDTIRPNYEATLNISTPDKAFSVEYECQVIPGTPQMVNVHPRIPRRQLLPGQIVEELALEVFDSFGNHVKEGEPVLLRLDGFSLQDLTNVVRKGDNDFILKVDSKGHVELGNTLKVSKGYGKDVVLLLKSEDKIIHKLEFQTERRELRTVTKVFKHMEIGSQLENVEFEITNAEGLVDKTINDDEKQGKLHTLTITSDSFDVDDSVRYSFRNGRCRIRAIPLPQREGVFSFTAAHSCYQELKLKLEVHIEKFRGENQDNAGNNVASTLVSSENLLNLPQSPSLEVPDGGNEGFNQKSLEENIPSFDYSTPLKAPKQEPLTDLGENLDGRIIPFLVSGSENSGNPASLVSLEALTDDLANWGLKIGEHERTRESLESARSRIQQDISYYQASIDRDSRDASTTPEQELIITQIESRSESAGAVICKSLRELPFEERPDDILGIVALLGYVSTVELSRMLAQYLGEEQMLAVVCKNFAAVENLEACTINKFAIKYGQSITGVYNVLCLEDIRPMVKGSGGDPNEQVPFLLPTLPDGSIPQGFLGFAINMISVEPRLLKWSTESGHGLRETLFYRLFGELQVYENRECMKLARSCIKSGAISLDGGIMRGNGLLSLGHWEPGICFPVRNSNDLSPYCTDILTQMEEKKLELIEINNQLYEENILYEMDKESFQVSRQRYIDFQNGVLP